LAAEGIGAGGKRKNKRRERKITQSICVGGSSHRATKAMENQQGRGKYKAGKWSPNISPDCVAGNLFGKRMLKITMQFSHLLH